MAQKNADIFAKYGLSSPKTAPAESKSGDVFAKYGLSAPEPQGDSVLGSIASTLSGNFSDPQTRSRDEFVRTAIDGVGDGIARVAKPIGDYVVSPAMKALDYVDAPLRAGVKAYQDQPEGMQFHPRGLIRPAMTAGKFALDEIRGLKSPEDAPKFDEVYKRTDIGRALNNPAIATPVGKFLLKAPGPDVPEEYGIDAEGLLGRDYDATSLEVGRKANELVGGGLLQAAMPSNLVLSAAPKALERVKLAREGFKQMGREALAAERAAEAAPPIRKAGVIDGVPPDPPATPPSGPQKPPEVPIISEAQVDDVRSATTLPNQPPSPPPGNVPEPLQPPESSAALEKYLEQAKGAGYNTELPQAAELERAEQVLGDLRHPVLPAQRNATKDPNARDKFRALKESGTATGKQISEYEQLQRQEVVSKVDETINQASPSGVANPDGVSQSETLQRQFIENYNERKKELGTAFSEFDNVAVDPMEHVPQLTDKIAQYIPDFEKYVESVSDDGVKLRPYSKKLGISRQEYNAISDVVTELGSGPVTVKELRNMRGALLREFPNPVDRPQVIGQLRKAMLDHLQDIIAGKNPSRREEVFKTFRDYAINESNVDELERVFGGSFSEVAAGTTKGFASEKVLDRIFANSKNAIVAKSAMGESAFNEAFASYLAQKKAAWTKDGVFSSRRFANWLQTKKAVFKKAGVDPNTLERLDALTTVLKFTADAPSVNPPGTAKTIGLLETIGNNLETPTSVGGVLSSGKKAIFGTASDLRRQSGAARTFDELSGVETKGLLEKAGEKLVSPETKALARKMKKAAKAKADELGKTAKEFIDDEEGKFSPEDLLNILKPNEENVFDLKKARGLVGEPKRGLLPGEADVIPNQPTWAQLTPEDRRLAEALAAKVQKGETLGGREQEYLESIMRKSREKDRGLFDSALTTRKAHFANETGVAEKELGDVFDRLSKKVDGGQNLTEQEFDFLKQVYHSADKKGDQDLLQKAHRIMVSDWQVKPKESPKGLLTSLDVERGPVTERPEAGTTSPFLINNRPPVLKPGTKVSLPDGDAGVTVGEYSYLDPERGRVYDVQTPFGRQQIAERELYGEKYKSYFDDKEKSNIAYRESIDRLRDSAKTQSTAEKAAEAERAKKGLIGVDFGGRGGKPKKTATEAGRDRMRKMAEEMKEPPKPKGGKGKPKKKKD